MANTNQYSTALPYTRDIPSWINQADGERLGVYKTYEDMYHLNPGSFDVMLRGVETPILVPSAKQIVNTLSRFVGKGFGFSVNPAVGTPEQQMEAIRIYGEFFKRETVLSKFKTAVRDMLKFGDAFWYIYADSNKPEGSRVSIITIDPGLIQKLTHPQDPDKVVGYQMVEQYQDGDAVYIQRSRWLKSNSPMYPGYNPESINFDAPVYYDKMLLQLEDWENPEKMKVQQVLAKDVFLPVATLPIYHFKNNAQSSDLYGSSELRSLENLFAAINQAVSDEDMALALAGLGLYRSSSGGPVDQDGNDVDWVIGPGRVIEDPTFERINGIATVDPAQKHIEYIEQKVDATAGITEVTKGGITAEIAESGIALSIKMAPTIDAADEKDLHIKDVFDQLLYDLKTWFAALEGWNLEEVEVETSFGEKLPRNRVADIKELLDLLAAGLFSKEYVLGQLSERFGYVIPADMLDKIAAENAAANASLDPYGERLNDESNAPDPTEEA